MELKVFETYKELSDKIANKIAAVICENPEAHICIAAGHTSLGPIESLIDLYEQNKVDFSRCHFTAMDEWVGMNEQTEGSCGYFLRKHFFSKVNFKEENICLCNGKAENLEEECVRIQNVLSSKGPLDFLLLGVGMNGHLALNEPGVDFNLSVHVTELDSVTKKVGKKYFDEKQSLSLSGGITFGIRDMEASKNCILAINGAHKKPIIDLILENEVSNSIPATVLKSWRHAALYCDRCAYTGTDES